MRQAIDQLDRQFLELHQRSVQLIQQTSLSVLYEKRSNASDSVGEQVLRSAAAIEQSFGGLTANLWDDPFEWTLPENLSTSEKLQQYLYEVEETRQRGFESLGSDDELSKRIMTPAGGVPLEQFLLDTFERSRHHLERAEAVFHADY